MSERRGPRRADILIGSAVLLVIVGGVILLAFQVRVSADRVKCTNNLRQLTLAIHNYRDAERHADQKIFDVWWRGMLARGVLFHPGAYENLFVSTAHTHDDVAKTLDAARQVAAELARAA